MSLSARSGATLISSCDTALAVADPEQAPPLRSTDPDDDYLIALAHSQKAVLVSGDPDLLELPGAAPICAPADYLRP